MPNSININHKTNEIMPTYDGKLYLKGASSWIDISDHCLYKGLSEPSSNIGVNGDYYALFSKKINLIKYSNNFNHKFWTNTHLDVIPEESVVFPSKYVSSKLIPTSKNAEHSLDVCYMNDITSHNSKYYFSLYALRNEYINIALQITDVSEKYGIRVIYNMYNRTTSMSIIGNNPNFINPNDFGIITCYDSNGVETDYVRIYLAAQFKNELYLKYKILVVDNNGNTKFSNKSTTDGLFISSAQINKDSLNDYVFSNGYQGEYFKLEKLYKKNINWDYYSDSNKLWFFDNIPNNDLGNMGDLAGINSLVKLGPIVRFGTANNVNKKTLGLLFWNEKESAYYCYGKKGLHKWMLRNRKPYKSGPLLAITLSNKTYNQWDYKQCSGTNHRMGYNTGGHSNFYHDNLVSYKRF